MPSAATRSDCLRLSVWSGPRNISTALMYSFRERADTRVVDEPLYGHYLRVTGAEHPGRDEVMAKVDTDGVRVVREVLFGPCDAPVLFFKNMAHHLGGLEHGIQSRVLSSLVNVLLTRHPQEMLLSLVNQVPHPTLRDTGLPQQVEVLEFILAQGQTPIVLDAREVLLGPHGVLEEACDRLGLPFDEAMLRWPAGPKPEDGVWAKHWYSSVHASTTFAPYRPKDEAFPARLGPLLEACLPYYDRLFAYALRVQPQ